MAGRILASRVLEFGYESDDATHGRGPEDGRLGKSVVPLDSKPQARSFMQAFVRRTQYNGMGCLQFKLDGPALKLIEVNPRPCGTMLRVEPGEENSAQTHLSTGHTLHTLCVSGSPSKHAGTRGPPHRSHRPAWKRAQAPTLERSSGIISRAAGGSRLPTAIAIHGVVVRGV